MITPARIARLLRTSGADVMRPRWDGAPGRLEAWYATMTDPATGTGFWFHAETVAPVADGEAGRGAISGWRSGSKGGREAGSDTEAAAGAAAAGTPAPPQPQPYAHGWAAVFPPDEPPLLARFGPEDHAPAPAARGFAAATARIDAAGLSGKAGAGAGEVTWDLCTTAGDGGPLYTFPRWSWDRPLLPAAQIVAQPGAAYQGTVTAGDRSWELVRAPGATARVYGHGNAHRWAWLHVDLGSGETLEVVAAVAARRGLSLLPALPFVRFRLADDGQGYDGQGHEGRGSGGPGFRDWPERPLSAALRLRARIGVNEWAVRGYIGSRRVDIRVKMDPRQVLALDYTDPDGGRAVCRNSERADAVVVLEHVRGDPRADRRWDIVGAAHTEIGQRG